MKSIFQLFLVILVMVFTSCRETKKEDVKYENIAIENVDSKLSQIAKEIEREEQELKKDLDELDKI